MTNKEAKEYLQPIADNAQLTGYSAALRKAIWALEEVDRLEAELKKRDGRDKLRGIFAKKQGQIIRQLMRDLKDSGRKDLCDFCTHSTAPLPCTEENFICDECTNEACACRECRDFDKWKWRGVVKNA